MYELGIGLVVGMGFCVLLAGVLLIAVLSLGDL